MKPIQYVEGMKLKTGQLYKTKNGLYRYIDNKLYTGVAKLEELEEEEELEESLDEIKLPLIPNKLFNKIQYFFQQIYTKHKAEVAVLLWYSFKIKKWKVEVPIQTVSVGSVNYIRDKEEIDLNTNKGYICVGSIHSHGEMSAFHSGTDDADEYNFDGLHITIGKVISSPTYACRFIVKNQDYKLKTEECIEINDEFEVEEWMEKVDKKQYQPNKNIQGMGLMGYDYNFKKNSYKDFTRCPICCTKVLSGKILCSECGFSFNEDSEEYLSYLQSASDMKQVVSQENFEKFKELQ